MKSVTEPIDLAYKRTVQMLFKPFDAAKWDIAASGLLGPVTLTPLRDTTDAAHD